MIEIDSIGKMKAEPIKEDSPKANEDIAKNSFTEHIKERFNKKN